MRLVPVNCIREGSYLAKTLYDTNGTVLLSKGYRLTNPVLKRVELSGISILYINDQYTDDEIEDFIKPELKQKAIKTIKGSFEGIAKYCEQVKLNPSIARRKQEITRKYKYTEDIAHLASDIVDEIVHEKNILINLVDIKSMDNYTYEHSISVTVLSIILGMELNLDKKRLVELAIGALLHDVGKVFVPKEILLKKDKLADDEFRIIQEHTTYGYDYIKSDLNISVTSSNIALQHHEKVDGTGYPEGAKNGRIHDYAKIVAIADVYDALTSDRPYRKAMSPNDAIEYIMGTAERHFDYKMVSAFIRKIVPYPKGSMVRLSSGEIGIIDEVNNVFPLRPKIKVIKKGGKMQHIDLMEEKDIVIKGIEYQVPEM